MTTATPTAPTSAPVRPATAAPTVAPVGAPNPSDPSTFLVVPPKHFEDLKVGDVFRAPSRTLTDAHTSEFQAVSLDNHPRHYNTEYAKNHGLPAMLVQPLQVLSYAAPGASLFTHYVGEVLVAWDAVSAKFLKDSFVGDTLYSTLQITNLTTENGKGLVTTAITIYNQRGELVLSGTQDFTLKLSPR